MTVGRLLIIAGICVVAAGLRLPGLAERPMDAEEAAHANKFGILLETGRYQYGPAGFHGTTLAYLTLAPALLRGQRRYAALNEATLRLAPALFGLLVVAGPLLLAGLLDRMSLVLASALVALSPAFVFYSRYYIPETLLVGFTALAMAAAWRFVQTRKLGWAVAAGAALGAMYATKETAVIGFAALGIACAGHLRQAGRRALLAGAGAAASVAVLLLSSLFLRPLGPFNSVRALFATYLGSAFQDPLHANPWYFYFGVLAQEWPVLVLAGAGAWRAVRDREPALRCVGVYALVVAAIYSVLPYKSPWCALNFWYPAMILAGAGAAWLLRTPEIGLRAATAVVLLFGLGSLSRQAWHFAVSDPAGPANPYVFAQTGPDVLAIRDRLAEAARAHPDAERLPVQVVATGELWPLPWYLRGYANVDWRGSLPETGTVAPVVLVTPDAEPAVARKLNDPARPVKGEVYGNFFERRVELSPGVELRGYASKSLRDRMK